MFLSSSGATNKCTYVTLHLSRLCTEISALSYVLFFHFFKYLLYTIIVYMCVGTFKTDSIFNPDYDSSGQWRFARNDSRYLRVVKKV